MAAFFYSCSIQTCFICLFSILFVAILSFHPLLPQQFSLDVDQIEALTDLFLSASIEPMKSFVFIGKGSRQFGVLWSSQGTPGIELLCATVVWLMCYALGYHSNDCTSAFAPNSQHEINTWSVSLVPIRRVNVKAFYAVSVNDSYNMIQLL